MIESLFALIVLVAASASVYSTTGAPDVQDAPPQPAVIVIGAGVAGLTAAATLHATGRFNVTLLEAMDRIGGRTHTVRFPNGYHIEMGAEWVQGEVGNAVYELVSPLGLLQNGSDPLTPLRPDQFQMQSNGRMLNETMAGLLWELYEKLEEDPEADVDGKGEVRTTSARRGSLGAYGRTVVDTFQEKQGLHASARFRNAVLDWLHRVMTAVYSANNWFEVSASDDGEQFEAIEGNDYIMWKPPYGYSSLHQLILTGNVSEKGDLDIPEWITLEKEVITIDYDYESGHERVCTRDGACYEADHVIFTPSLGALKAKHDTLFTPQLSARKQLAIQNIGFGSATKYYLEFSAPWWPADYNGVFPIWDDIEYDDRDPRWMYWRSNITAQELQTDLGGFPLWTRAICRIFTIDSRSHPNMLRAWVTGPASRYLDYWDPAYVRAHLMRVVRRFMAHVAPRGQIPAPIGVYQSKWRSNPFTRGVYSFRSVDSDRHDVWARDLANPITRSSDGKPLICFAGEATHPKYYSTVHGAYETGLREAERIRRWYSSTGGAPEGQIFMVAISATICILFSVLNKLFTKLD